jgi:RNA polymerase sigma factor (sigma-70 family)
MSSSTKTSRKMDITRQDHLLVQDCLHGNQEAWSALIDKYKNLIFSIPIKRGFPRDDAADIFQTVCLALVSELPRLREPRALPAWLIQTTSHKCFQWQDKSWRSTKLQEEILSGGSPKVPEELLAELQREQIVRDAVAELSTQCRRLVELLFYQVPASSYDDLAASLEIPKGSVGPTRIRCLEKLRRLLEKKGF